MKKLILLLSVILLCSFFWHGAKISSSTFIPLDTIQVDPAPDGLPQIKEDWQTKAQEIIDASYNIMPYFSMMKVLNKQLELKDALIKGLPDTEMFWIGDCKEPGRLYNAIHEGFYTASQI